MAFITLNILLFNDQVERGAMYNIELYDAELRGTAERKDNGTTQSKFNKGHYFSLISLHSDGKILVIQE